MFSEVMLLNRRITPNGPVIAKAYTLRVINQESTEEKPSINIVKAEFSTQVLKPETVIINKCAYEYLPTSLPQSLVDNTVANESVHIPAPQSLVSSEIVGPLEVSQPETLSVKEKESHSPVIPVQETSSEKPAAVMPLSESRPKPGAKPLMSDLFISENKEQNNDSKVVTKNESKVSPKLYTKPSIRVETSHRNIPKTQKSNSEWTEVPKKKKSTKYGKSSAAQRATPITK